MFAFLGNSLLGQSLQNGIFAFGNFNSNGYYSYELLLFLVMGAAGGLMGSFFNAINREVTILRMKYLTTKSKQLAELLILTLLFAIITFVFPLMWTICTDLPTDTADWTADEQDLVNDLVRFQCGPNQYNQVASLYFTDSDTAMQQLFHFKEVNGSSYDTFSTGALLMFFIPYFSFAAITSGTFCPAGLFIPTLFAGASFGRIIGHILNCAAPGYVTDSGTYALIGAASLLGGMSRMTIAGTIIILEATGNPGLLLPLMVTFAAARYSGNAINKPLYDMMIELKEMPFLEGSLKTLGLLNYHPVTEIMGRPVDTLYEINRVGAIYDLLKKTKHNGFPVVGKDGHLRGLILRKHLCSLLKLKAFSRSMNNGSNDEANKIEFTPAAAVFHDTLERNYPRYPKIEEIDLSLEEMVSETKIFVNDTFTDTDSLSLFSFRTHGWISELIWTRLFIQSMKVHRSRNLIVSSERWVYVI
jgi:chloride channel 7